MYYLDIKSDNRIIKTKYTVFFSCKLKNLLLCYSNIFIFDHDSLNIKNTCNKKFFNQFRFIFLYF